MKKLFDYLCVLTILLSTAGLVSAQNFTVKIESTDDYGGYIKPIKAGGSHQFQIEVKNNRSDTCTVSIVKSAMGEVESWISINDNSKVLFPGQERDFLVTINVPGSAGDRDYTLWLSFNAYDKDGFNHSFQYDNQIIIVDNSKPTVPTFSISQTGSTITAYTLRSWDERSAWYTSKNSTSGFDGIKSFKIVLTKPNGTKVSKSIDPIKDDSHTFTGLAPNTNYTTSVTAIDLVGHSNSAEIIATTSPAKPTGLSFSNTTYISTTLSWNTSAGATGYNIYKVAGGTNTKLNSSPVTGNSYTINNLNPSTIYAFNIIASSNVGSSDRSANASVATLALPPISGTNILCSGGSTFTVSNLLSGYTVSWSKSSNLKLMSQSGPSAVFMVLRNGSGWIDAEIIAPNGRTLELTKKYLWVGKPNMPITSPSGYPTFEMQLGAMQRINLSSHTGASATSGNWWLSGNSVQIINTYNGGGILVEAVNRGLTNFYVTTSNSCGTSAAGGGLIKVSRNGGGGLPIPLSISPNPGNSFVNLDFTPKKQNVTSLAEREQPVYEISIYSKAMELIYHNKTTETKLTFNTSGLKKGFYYVNIRKGKDVSQKQFFVRHD